MKAKFEWTVLATQQKMSVWISRSLIGKWYMIDWGVDRRSVSGGLFRVPERPTPVCEECSAIAWRMLWNEICTGLFYDQSGQRVDIKQGKSKGFYSCEWRSNLIKIGPNHNFFSPVWPWNLMDDQQLLETIGPWGRHQMETFSALPAFCAGNSPVPGEFSSQRPVMRSFDVSFDLRMNKWLTGNRKAGDLRRHRAHYDVNVMASSMLCQTLWIISSHWWIHTALQSRNTQFRSK